MQDIVEWREYARVNKIPIISLNTEKFLKTYILQYKPQTLLEVWSAVGYSALIFRSIMRQYTETCSIFSREVSYPHYYQALAHTRNISEIRLYYGDFCQYPLQRYITPSAIDMVFIDGRKSETLEYMQSICHFIHPTSHIIIDDVIKFKFKMKSWYEFLDTNTIPYKIEYLDKDDGIMIVQSSQFLIQALTSL